MMQAYAHVEKSQVQKYATAAEPKKPVMGVL